MDCFRDIQRGLGVATVLLILVVCLVPLPEVFVPSRVSEDFAGVEQLTGKDRLQFAEDRRKLQNDIRTALVQAVAGGALLVGLLFTWQQQRATNQQVARQLAVTQRGQASEHFTRAIEQLGSPRQEVQLGGIYGLGEIAQQAPENRLTVVQVLAAYLRRRSALVHGRPEQNRFGLIELRIRAPDLQAAITVLGQHVKADDPPLDLRRLDLGGAYLAGASLAGVDLRGTDIGWASNLQGADLSGANLVRAGLFAADLRGAKLRGAKLQGTALNCSLENADLSYADLSYVSGRYLNLRGARLQGATLFGADLSRANLQGTNLSGAHADGMTKWPSGFDWRAAGVRMSERSP
jgi:uncharacterized protein YjbI with pentapeptide repeats